MANCFVVDVCGYSNTQFILNEYKNCTTEIVEIGEIKNLWLFWQLLYTLFSKVVRTDISTSSYATNPPV